MTPDSFSDGGRFEFPDVALAQARKLAAEGAAIIKAIRAAIAQEHEVHPYAILLVAPGSAPVTSSGKLARRRTRDLFLKGELSAIAQWYSVESPNAQRGDGP